MKQNSLGLWSGFFAGYAALLNWAPSKLQFTDSAAHLKTHWDFVRSGRGTVLINGCSHAGFYNYVNSIICQVSFAGSSWGHHHIQAKEQQQGCLKHCYEYAKQTVLYHSSQRLFDMGGWSFSNGMAVFYFKKWFISWVSSFCVLQSLTLLNLLFYCSITALFTLSHCYRKPISSWNSTQSFHYTYFMSISTYFSDHWVYQQMYLLFVSVP